jgi:predicted nucleic acid-binding protein
MTQRQAASGRSLGLYAAISNMLESIFKSIFNEILVPPAVAREIAASVPPQPWISERELTQPLAPQVLQASLGPGESEAISLALELGARWVILDERSARRVAEALGLPVVGTLGILLAAKRRGLLDAVYDHGSTPSSRPASSWRRTCMSEC